MKWKKEAAFEAGGAQIKKIRSEGRAQNKMEHDGLSCHVSPQSLSFEETRSRTSFSFEPVRLVWHKGNFLFF